MSDTSLVFNVLARDKASKVFAQVRRSALESGSAIRAALGPALAPALASAGVAAIGLGAALAGAGAAAGVFGAVFKSSFTEVQEASKKSDDLRDKIQLLTEQMRVAEATGLGEAGKYEKARAKAMNELMSRYNLLPPATRRAVMAYDAMKDSWQGFVDANKPATYGVMTSGLSLLASSIPKLQPLFLVAKNAAERFMAALTTKASDGGIQRMIGWLANNAAPALNNLGRIGKNLGITLGAMLSEFDSTGQGILKWLAEATDKMAAWAKQTEGGGLGAFVEYIKTNGPKVFELLSNLASAAITIAKAVAPLAPISLAIASALAAIIAALPPGVITALVAAWIAYSIAVKGYHAAALVAGVATTVAAAAQKVWNAAMVAARWVAVAGQIALMRARTVAVAVANKVAAAGQWLWNAAITAGAWVAATAQIIAYHAAGMAVSAATKIWAATQAVLNLALWTSPITWIVVGIVALIAVIVLIATKTTWFQTAWNATWGAVKWAFSAALQAIVGGFNSWWATMSGAWRAVGNFFASIGRTVAGYFGTMSTKIINAGTSMLRWWQALPGKIKGALSGVFSPLWNGFKTALNRIIGGWNRLSFTIGGGSFMGMSVPSASFGTPDLPYLAKGGTIDRAGMAIVGERGPELVSLARGAQVTPLTGRGNGGAVVIEVRSGGTAMDDLLVEMLRGAIKRRGGNVQTALGR
ncbi:hypothetical protein ACFYPX_18085 [Micromonospora zamorensis]|uniref:hypothetical protein n=1 Tax=Micromonospora zamorensis TaxID=709883 RepID=UPI0036CD5316